MYKHLGTRNLFDHLAWERHRAVVSGKDGSFSDDKKVVLLGLGKVKVPFLGDPWLSRHVSVFRAALRLWTRQTYRAVETIERPDMGFMKQTCTTWMSDIKSENISWHPKWEAVAVHYANLATTCSAPHEHETISSLKQDLSKSLKDIWLACMGTEENNWMMVMKSMSLIFIYPCTFLGEEACLSWEWRLVWH